MFKLLFDGSDSRPTLRFDTRNEAERYLKANSPSIYRSCQHQIDIVEVKNV